MNCITCGAKTLPGTNTDVTDLGKCMVIVRNVPCYKCVECNEIMYTGNVIKKLEGIIESTKRALTGIAIIEYDDKVA